MYMITYNDACLGRGFAKIWKLGCVILKFISLDKILFHSYKLHAQQTYICYHGVWGGLISTNKNIMSFSKLNNFWKEFV